MEKTEVVNQKVTVYDDGSIEVISDKGRYFNEEHSCVISDIFIIDSKSVKNLMLLFSKKNPALKCVGIECYKTGYVYVNSDSVVANLTEENNELEKKLRETEQELNHTKNVMMSLESSCDIMKSELKKYKSLPWWKRIFNKNI